MYIERDNSVDSVAFVVQRRDRSILRCFDELGLSKCCRILNIQCGDGVLATTLLQRGFEVHAVGRAQEVVKLAQENCGKYVNNANIFFSVGDAEEMDFADDSFDAAIVVGEIEHLKWYRWALQEISRIIKPGGYLILSVPSGIALSNCRSTTDSEKKDTKLYRPVSLKRLLKSLDFEVLDSCGGSEWRLWAVRLFDALSRKLGKLCEQVLMALFSGITTDYIIVCRKPKPVERIEQKAIFLNIEDNVKLFELKHSEMFERRNTWLEKNPEYHDSKLIELDISSFAGENVLVISPHPDDEVIGCGGTLIRLIGAEASVAVIQMTDGSASSALNNCPEDLQKTIRIQESEEAAKSLGLSELISWKEKDNRLECTPINIEKLTGVLDNFRPKLVFVPFVNDPHKDHVAANLILAESLKGSTLDLGVVKVLSYEVWCLVPANCYCTIDNQFKKKTQMLMKYRTGMKVIDYVHFCESLNSYESYILSSRKGFVEAFLNLSAQNYLDLIEIG